MDYLLTKRIFDSAKEVEDAWNFINQYLKEAAKIMVQSADLMKQLQTENNYDPALVNIYTPIALLHSQTEFLFVVHSLLGNRDGRI